MKVGFIGLGIMGKPMAINLMKNGHELKVYNRSKGSVEELVSMGATAAKSIGDASLGVDALITMLPDSPDVRNVMIGEDGVLHHAAEGLLYIDMSSILPEVSIEVGKKLAEKGIHMLDAPVSGGDLGAIAGTLAIMAGGTQEDFDRAIPLFEAMGSSHVLVGPLGSGNTCKLANNMIVAGNLAILSEALILCRKSGTDLSNVINAIRGGSAGSAVLETKTPKILNEDYRPGFKVDLHIKDLRNALKTGLKLDLDMPVTEMVMGMYKELSEEGMGSDDHSSLFRYYENHSR